MIAKSPATVPQKEPILDFSTASFRCDTDMFDAFGHVCEDHGFVPITGDGMRVRRGDLVCHIPGPGLTAARRFIDPDSGTVLDITPHRVNRWTWPNQTPGQGCPSGIDEFIRALIAKPKG